MSWCRCKSGRFRGRDDLQRWGSRSSTRGPQPRMSADAVTSRPLTRPRLVTVGLEVQRRWTAAAHVGCGRSTILVGGARLRLVEPPAGDARVTSKEGAHGGTMGSPVIGLAGKHWFPHAKGRVRRMERAYGLEIPQSLEEACDPARLALIVYDMQVGILRQLRNPAEPTAKVVQVLGAARGAGVRVVFTRHMSLPNE